MGPAGIVRLADRELERAGINTLALAYNSTTSTLLNNCKIIIFGAKLRELSVYRCGTGRHCKAGRPGATEGRH